MNIISQLRQRIRENGKAEITISEFNQLQSEWIMRIPSDQEIDRLRSENEALRKDAERYRWLRDESNKTRENSPCVVDDCGNVYLEADLDAVIDAELKELEK